MVGRDNGGTDRVLIMVPPSFLMPFHRFHCQLLVMQEIFKAVHGEELRESKLYVQTL